MIPKTIMSKRYTPQIFHPLFTKKGTTSNEAQSKNEV